MPAVTASTRTLELPPKATSRFFASSSTEDPRLRYNLESAREAIHSSIPNQRFLGCGRMRIRETRLFDSRFSIKDFNRGSLTSLQRKTPTLTNGGKGSARIGR